MMFRAQPVKPVSLIGLNNQVGKTCEEEEKRKIEFDQAQWGKGKTDRVKEKRRNPKLGCMSSSARTHAGVSNILTHKVNNESYKDAFEMLTGMND